PVLGASSMLYTLNSCAPSTSCTSSASASLERSLGKKFYELVLPAFISEEYLPESSLRIDAYRHVATAPNRDALKKLEKEWRDRFGPLPGPVSHLLMTETIRRAAVEHGVSKVETRGNKLMLTRKGDFLLLGHQFPRLAAVKPESKLVEILGFLDSLN
ncbi:MAG TPA: TRCF domain-containing protein, partial [Chthoniobacterales bacterium]|nr:TRCF domain-containing protein [Chthoniobacterales bacterium]